MEFFFVEACAWNLPSHTVHVMENNDQVDLSIIIVNWNTKELLRQCIQSIYDTTHKTKFDIWVIDNGSTDGSIAMLQNEFPRIRLVCSNANLGFARANNLGICKSQGRFVCLINSDARVLNQCIDKLVEYLDLDPEIGLIGPKMLNSDLTLQISCYGFPNVWNSFCYAMGFDQLFPRSRWLAGTYKQYWPYADTRPVDAISGCFCVARREAINRVGLLDEHFFMYMEDFDWCKRFRKAGWEVFYFPEAHAIHHGGGSSSNGSEKHWIERSRSKLRYWNKHHGRLGKWYIMALIFFRHLLRTLQGVFAYLLQPSQRIRSANKIKESTTNIVWLLDPHREK